VTRAFSYLLLAAALSGCTGGKMAPPDYRSETNRSLYRSGASEGLPAGESAFGSGFGAEWRKLGEPQFGTSPTASAASSSLTAEQREFEDWRAWQEWKRKNPK
jgi:hypothetical protein